jgi:hypothetical protein
LEQLLVRGERLSSLRRSTGEDAKSEEFEEETEQEMVSVEGDK